MNDIVERLRVWPAAYGEDSLSSTYVGWVMKQAADEIERLRDDAPAQGAPWQPIKTAPKDGTRILVGIKDRFPKNTYVARWLRDAWSIGPLGGEWHAYPTHWMPIPALSSTDGGAK